MEYNKITSYINYKDYKIQEFGHRIKCCDNYNQWLPPRIFYRGESEIYNKTSNVAGVYRSNYQESSLYHNYMSRFPKKFGNMRNYSKLTYMQHFGLPTCLLDITSNFLVALYFACCHICRDKKGKPKNNFRSSGKVWIILPKVPKDKLHSNKMVHYKIYNNYSDTIDILSTLALFKTTSQHDIFNKIENFTTKYSNKCGRFFRNIVHGNQNIPHNKMYKDYIKLMKSYSFRRFIHKMKQTNIGFQPNIDFNHLFSPKIVQPAFTNLRIKAQQGYFILENYKSNNKAHYVNRILFNDEKISDGINKNFTLKSIIIPNINKESILRALDIQYGINRARLFPDYGNVAKYVKDEFNFLK